MNYITLQTPHLVHTITQQRIYNQVYIEISGKCNAKCPWCVTGIENRNHPELMPSMKKNIMSLDKFMRIIKHLLQEKIVDKNTMFALYNWGEPFLHPYLKDIIEFMNKNEFQYELSTNASILLKVDECDKNFFRNLRYITFSCCGFSQESYDRINSFNFIEIQENIYKILNKLRKYGFVGKAIMAYHVYQFNQGFEIQEAKLFCDKLDIGFAPSYAFINDHERTKQYLINKLDYGELKKMGKDLCFFYLDDLLRKGQKEKGYKCRLLEYLTINENGYLLPCCSVQNEILGEILELSNSDIMHLMKKIHSCKECINSGHAYWITNPRRYSMSSGK